MLDSTTVELHLIHDSLRVSYNTIGILTVDTVNKLPKSEFSELITINDNIIRTRYKRDFHDAEINILELPNEKIQ